MVKLKGAPEYVKAAVFKAAIDETIPVDVNITVFEQLVRYCDQEFRQYLVDTISLRIVGEGFVKD